MVFSALCEQLATGSTSSHRVEALSRSVAGVALCALAADEVASSEPEKATGTHRGNGSSSA
jgi:hypothetical protein